MRTWFAPHSVAVAWRSLCGCAMMGLALTALPAPLAAQDREASPSGPRLHNQCYDAVLSGDARLVVRLCTRAIGSADLSDRDRVDALIYRALAYKSLGMYNPAMSDYDAAARLAPGDSIVFGNRGNLHRVMKRYERALRDLGRAIQLDSRNASAHYARGLTYEALGFENEAAQSFERAYELWPDNRDLRGKARERRN